ncbi:hypothetical protein AAVH_05195 [Aphelenchoides avenae]|nr:hypothetical protein AAVH_05195 [Aphelenchus avenae]
MEPFWHKPKPWIERWEGPRNRLPPTRNSLAKVVRELKVRNAASMFEKHDKSTRRELRQRGNLPFLRKNIDDGVNEWPLFQAKCVQWAEKHPPRGPRAEPTSSEERDARTVDETGVSARRKHQELTSNAGATLADNVDEHDVEADEQALLISFYTVFHSSKILDQTAMKYKKEYPDLETFSRSKHVQNSIRRPQKHELQAKVYQSRSELTEETLQALDLWRRRQQPALLVYAQRYGEDEEDGFEVWNRAMRNLQRRKERAGQVLQQRCANTELRIEEVGVQNSEYSAESNHVPCRPPTSTAHV